MSGVVCFWDYSEFYAGLKVSHDLLWHHIMSRINTTVSPNKFYSSSAVDLYSEGAGRSTGYPAGFYSLSQFRRENSAIVLRLGKDGLIGNSFQFLIISQPSIQRCIGWQFESVVEKYRREKGEWAERSVSVISDCSVKSNIRRVWTIILCF